MQAQIDNPHEFLAELFTGAGTWVLEARLAGLHLLALRLRNEERAATEILRLKKLVVCQCNSPKRSNRSFSVPRARIGCFGLDWILAPSGADEHDLKHISNRTFQDRIVKFPLLVCCLALFLLPAFGQILPNFTGIVRSFERNTLTIEGSDANTLDFRCTRKTAYFDGKTKIKREALKQGDRVSVEATRAPDASLDAVNVRLERPPAESK
jgi:hypothetical protein